MSNLLQVVTVHTSYDPATMSKYDNTDDELPLVAGQIVMLFGACGEDGYYVSWFSVSWIFSLDQNTLNLFFGSCECHCNSTRSKLLNILCFYSFVLFRGSNVAVSRSSPDHLVLQHVRGWVLAKVGQVDGRRGLVPAAYLSNGENSDTHTKDVPTPPAGIPTVGSSHSPPIVRRCIVMRVVREYVPSTMSPFRNHEDEIAVVVGQTAVVHGTPGDDGYVVAEVNGVSALSIRSLHSVAQCLAVAGGSLCFICFPSPNKSWATASHVSPARTPC
eukprot:m.1033192 g.1033192  ORF g.1033192 m.1033192 type:complete len:273 (+) comp24130_c0_seq12:75-893(+)